MAKDAHKLRRLQVALGLRDEDVAQCIPEEVKAVSQAATPKESAHEKEGSPQSFTEDLGHGVKLEMVRIPKGSFLMGAADGDEFAYRYEKPQHLVEIS